MHEYIIKPVRPCKQLTCRALFGAPERTRTFTGEPPLEPESSASTNSATSALRGGICLPISSLSSITFSGGRETSVHPPSASDGVCRAPAGPRRGREASVFMNCLRDHLNWGTYPLFTLAAARPAGGSGPPAGQRLRSKRASWTFIQNSQTFRRPFPVRT